MSIPSLCTLCVAEGNTAYPTPIPCPHDEASARVLRKHVYSPVWDETLKSWINRPPHAKPGQGAKE